MNLSGTRLDFGLYSPVGPLTRRWRGSRKRHRNGGLRGAGVAYFPFRRLSAMRSRLASENPSEYALGITTVPPEPFTDS